ncbi:MAG: NifB/NifX family molybdenum-iron cluster-binding protein [Anaerolineae bacterium]
MKVAVSSNGPDITSAVSPIFGRSPYFVLVDTESNEARTILNPAVSASGGAGVQSSQMLIREGAEAAIGINVGPNPTQVFMAGGVPVYQATGGTVKEAIEALKAGQLPQLGAATVGKDYGKSAVGGRGMGSGGRAAGG